MDDIEISRRQILATAGTAGGAGALMGTGTAALLSETITFAENEIVGGAIDLLVDWDVDDGGSGTSEGTATIDIDLTDENRSGSATFDVRLPDDGSNNPAYGWFRLTCPKITELVTDLEVDIYYECDGVQRPLVPETAESLCEVANALRNGIPLDPGCETGVTPGEQACIQPGKPVTIGVDWELGENYEGQDETSLVFDFVGRQCRDRDGTENPFPEVPECDCPTGKAISWVAFCGEDLDPSEFVFDVTVDTLHLHQASPGLETVVLKYGTYIRVFDNPTVPGTYETKEDEPGDEVYEQSGNSYPNSPLPRTNNDPCPNGCGLKYEGDDDFASADQEGCDR